MPYGEQLFRCHCEAFRADLMMKYLTSVDVNKKSIAAFVKCLGLILWWTAQQVFI